MTNTRRTWCIIATAVAAMSVALSGCSKGAVPDSDKGPEDASGFLSEVDARVDTLYAGTYGTPPTDSPPAATGKNVWVISYLQAFTAAAKVTGAVEEAAQSLGWDATVFDAKGDPSEANEGINQAIADGADAIVTVFWDCNAVKAGLIAAEAAGVVAIGDEVVDCEDKPLYDYVVSYSPGVYEGNDGQFLSFAVAWAKVLADYIISKSEGQAKIVNFVETDLQVTLLQDKGFTEQVKVCTTCEIVDRVEFTGADLGPNLQQKAQQAFLKHPDANAIVVGADFVLTSGVLAALKSSGLYGKVIIAGGEGGADTLPQMVDYPGDWGFSNLPLAWEGWAAVDAANRIFNGEDPATNTGMGLQILDKDHNQPPADSPVPMKDGEPVDFPGLYQEAWGVSN